MAEMTIELRVDPQTGKRDILIGLRSDADALPMEHEQHHRELVNKLLEKGIITEEEIGKVIVEREQPAEEELPQTEAESTPEQARQAHAEGN
ncbi:Hypothetical protein PBC10988_17430 [Planctomycetales bacterium 10988]|nr:Hypothetical protein PBC10988_17430 [Planctomycetales bacterium 10988]